MEFYEKSKAKTDVAAAMSESTEDTVTFLSGIEFGLVDYAEVLSAQEV